MAPVTMWHLGITRRKVEDHQRVVTSTSLWRLIPTKHGCRTPGPWLSQEDVSAPVGDAGHLTAERPQLLLELLVVGDLEGPGVFLVVEIKATNSFQLRGDRRIDRSPRSFIRGLWEEGRVGGESMGRDGPT